MDDLERVISLGVNVHAVEAGHIDLSSPAGRAVARTITAWATYEGEQKALRQKAANDQRALAGLPPTGRRCYGYTADGMEIEPAEAVHVRKAVDLILEGVPLRTALRRVDEDGCRTTAGGRWQPTQFRRYLTNPRLVGQRVHRGEVVGQGVWPPLLTPEEHTGLVAILADPARRPKGRPNTYLLSGVARCGTCGAKIYGRVERRGPIYVCQSHAHLGRKIADIDAYVEAVVTARLSLPDAVDAFAAPSNAGRATELRDEERVLADRLDGLATAYATGEISLAQMTSGTKVLRARMEEIEAELPELTASPAMASLVRAEDVQEAWGRLDVGTRRAVVGMLADVVIKPAGRGARFFDPETVAIEWRGAKWG